MTTNGFRQPTPPAYWTKSSAQVDWWNRIASASTSILMLDYDGTLAPFHVDRMSALPYPGIEERMNQLLALDSVSLVLVTGRPAAELRTLFPLAQRIDVWASHGRELHTAAGEHHLFDLNDAQASLLASFESDLAKSFLPARALERKPASLAIHWRGLESDEQETIRERVLNRYSTLPQDSAIELLPFEDGLEIRAMGRTKADAVHAILDKKAPSTPLAYLGDDRTDEDAFGALGNDDLALLVRDTPRATLADYWLAPPEDLLAFLDRWIAAARESHKLHSRTTA